jgi:penicillin-binding protein 1C
MTARRLKILLVSTALAVVAAFGSLIWAASLELPAGSLDPRSVAGVRIEAADGSLLREVLSREDGRARWVPLHHISGWLIQATLASEDRRFLEHRGVDWLAMIRAAALNAWHGRVVSGGSTLTMQLVRLMRPRRRCLGSLRSCARRRFAPSFRARARAKIEEIALAGRLERQLGSKQAVLRHYLNRAPYGNGTFGAEAAARRYFNKPASALSLAEAALLAALPRSPSGYNPFQPRRRQRLLRRQRHILALMEAQGRIGADQHRRALAEPIAWESAARPFRAPHLTRRVLAHPLVRRASRVETTIDPKLQKTVLEAARQKIERLSRQGVGNAAVLVVENATGEVLAYVGSVDFFDARDAGQVDGTGALRQPGSTMKPFTYALALEQGHTPASILADLPAHFATDQGDYHPRNYDDTFHGPVRLRVALGSSYNVPAVRTTEAVGVDRLLSRLRALGMRSLSRSASHYGLGLTLGNGEVTLHELTAAYAALARGGRYLPLRFVRRVHTLDGRVLEPRPPRSRRVFSRQVAHLVTHMLADPAARLPAFGRDTVLDVGFAAAVKTGTSKDFRDNWTVGYSQHVTVGVWVGNFSGNSMQNVSGITGAGPLWAEAIIAAQDGRESRFHAPSGLVRRSICPLSGQLAGPGCGAGTEELFIAGTEPRAVCGWHREVAIDTRNGLLAASSCPSAHVERRPMTVYPPRYRRWAHGRGHPAPPTSSSPLCEQATAGASRVQIRIRFPMDGDRYFVDPDLRRAFQRIPLEATVHGPAAREVRWRVDGRVVARAPYPYSARWPIVPGRHIIVAELPGGARSRAVTVTVR